MWPITGSIAERRQSSHSMAEDAALLTGDEDATRVSGVVAASIFAKIVFALFAPMSIRRQCGWSGWRGPECINPFKPRRLKATNQLPKLIAGVRFHDGIVAQNPA